eukprot:130340_1
MTFLQGRGQFESINVALAPRLTARNVGASNISPITLYLSQDNRPFLKWNCEESIKANLEMECDDMFYQFLEGSEIPAFLNRSSIMSIKGLKLKGVFRQTINPGYVNMVKYMNDMTYPQITLDLAAKLQMKTLNKLINDFGEGIKDPHAKNLIKTFRTGVTRKIQKKTVTGALYFGELLIGYHKFNGKVTIYYRVHQYLIDSNAVIGDSKSLLDTHLGFTNRLIKKVFNAHPLYTGYYKHDEDYDKYQNMQIDIFSTKQASIESLEHEYQMACYRHDALDSTTYNSLKYQCFTKCGVCKMQVCKKGPTTWKICEFCGAWTHQACGEYSIYVCPLC